MTAPLPQGFTGRLLGVFEEDSAEWHAARHCRIGASEIGVILGWAPPEWFRGRADVLAQKLAPLEVKPTKGKAQRLGHYAESAGAAWFADETGAEYVPGRPGTYVHPDLDFMVCNPDRICVDGSLLEIKTAPEKAVEKGWGRGMTDQIPLVYAAQVQWQMHITGLRLCWLAVLFGQPFQFTKYKIRYDPAVAEYLIRHGRIFYDQMTQHAKETAA